jgi:hypothetical protein
MFSRLQQLTVFIFLVLFVATTSYSMSCTKDSKFCQSVPDSPLDISSSTFDCYGKNSSDPYICSGNGNCTFTNNCTCKEGYLGLQCQYKPATVDAPVQVVMIVFVSISAGGTILGLSIASIAIFFYIVEDIIYSSKDKKLQTKLYQMNLDLKKQTK